MLSKDAPLPSFEISKRETQRRKKIIEQLLPDLKQDFSEVLLVGSMAYGQEYSVHEKSDLDFLIFVSGDDFAKIDSKKWGVPRQVSELYVSGKVAHISGIVTIDGVKCEFHFWHPKTHMTLIKLQQQFAPRFSSSGSSASGSHLNFSGEECHRESTFKTIPEGYIQGYRSFDEVNGRFVPYEPFVNLLLPSINLVGDSNTRIETAWSVCRERCAKEHSSYPDSSILKSLAPVERIRPELLEELRNHDG